MFIGSLSIQNLRYISVLRDRALIKDYQVGFRNNSGLCVIAGSNGKSPFLIVDSLNRKGDVVTENVSLSTCIFAIVWRTNYRQSLGHIF